MLDMVFTVLSVPVIGEIHYQADLVFMPQNQDSPVWEVSSNLAKVLGLNS